MSLLDLASLVLAPTATKEGKVYSAIPNTGDGDMTFSRGSAATRVNSAGLIEKERTNLLLQSNTFDTTWSGSVSVASGYAGYDNSNDAWLLSKGAGQYLSLVSGSLSNSGVQTYSIYCKAATLNLVTLFVSYSGSNKYVEFDLTDGSVNAQTSSGIIDSGSTSMGNGWYRLYMTINEAVTGVRVYPDWINSVAGGVYIQDAMLNQGLVAQSYIETTTSAVYEGITDDVPRVDYSGGGCPALKLEPQRTNLFPQSEYLKDTTHWQVTNVSFSVNQGTSPEGQNNAIKVVPNSTGAAFWLDNTTLTSGQPYVLSFYAKSNGWDYLQVTNSSGVGGSEKENFDIINGTSNGDYATGDAVIEEFGNGWYKIIVKGTANESTGRMIIALSSGLNMIRLGSVTPSGDDGVLLYGFQWEQGSYSTSYIPTYGAAVTRGQDACFKTGISSLIGQTAGTIFLEMLPVGSTNSYTERLIKIYGGGQEIGLQRYANSRLVGYGYLAGPNNEWTFDIADVFTSTTQSVKIAMAYASNDVAIYVNGVQKNTDSSASMFSALSVFTFAEDTAGNLLCPQNVKQAILFPTRLTNTELADLTTL